MRPFAVSMGDPAGIGPEITGKAWSDLRASPEHAFAVVASADLFSDVPHIIINNISDAPEAFPSALPILALEGETARPGHPDTKHAAAIIESISQCTALCLSGDADGLVTNPIAKHILYDAGFNFPGHTEFLGHLAAGHPAPYAPGPVMMLAAQDLRVGLATVHIPLKSAADQISIEGIAQTARVMLGALKLDFGITEPRLALTGLNPHAGEAGALGLEEIEIINPAAEILRHEGHDVTDAQPADTLFHAEARRTYDAVLAMYHDQGLIPVKTLDFHGGVNITLGLPFIRTSPDHGTAFGIAGSGQARADSLIAAIKTARTNADNRYGN